MECFGNQALIWGLSYGNGTPNTVNGNLASDTTPRSVVCGLTGVGGIFSTGSTTNGVRVYPTLNILGHPVWAWEASGWKGV